MRLSLTVNGAARRVDVPDRTSLADVLRDHLGLTGTRLGCEHGVCGACTVFVDGRPTRSCIQLAGSCEGAEVVTIEGLEGREADVVREAFSRAHGLQCGFCTAGMLTTALDVVARRPDASEAEIRRELSGNICRCTGYAGIVEAIRTAAETLHGAQGNHEEDDG